MKNSYAHISLLDNLPPVKDGSFNFLIDQILMKREFDISISLKPKNQIKKARYFFIEEIKINVNGFLIRPFFKLISPWITFKTIKLEYFVKKANLILKQHGIKKIVIWGYPELVDFFRVIDSSLYIVFAQRHFEYDYKINPYEFSNLIVFQNYGQIKRALEKYLQISTPYVVIPNGAELELFKPGYCNGLKDKLNLKPNDFVLIFPSKFAPHKGTFFLPTLINKLIEYDKRFKLLIVGSKHPKYERGKFKIDYEILEKKLLALGENIIWIRDGVNRKEMVDYYNVSDVSIFPNMWKEGFSMAATECLSSGLPVIAPNSGCFKEIIKDDYNGYLVEQSNLVENIIARILEISNNRNLHSKLKSNSREYAENYLSRDKLLSNFDYLLRGQEELIDSEL